MNAIPRLLEDLLAYGAGDPERWGITRCGQVAPLALADGLSLADLVRLSGAAIGPRHAAAAWVPFVRSWLLDASPEAA